MIGKELGMFVEKKEVERVRDELDQLSDLELVQKLMKSAQLLLVLLVQAQMGGSRHGFSLKRRR